MILYLIAYLSEKMSPTEYNYRISNKVLLAIVVCFDKWYMYLHTLPKPFAILTDYYNLESFKTNTLLNHWQACWARELTQYNFTIMFQPGEKYGKADILTHRSGDLYKEGDEHAQLVRALIPLSTFSEFSLSAASISFNDEIQTLLPSNALGKSILLAFKNFKTKHPILKLY